MDTVSTGTILFWFLFFLILSIPGYFLQKQAKKGIKERQQSRAWLVVEGVISDTAIEERKRATSRRTITGGHSRITVYQPVITYSFKVDGRNFKASRYRNNWPGEWTDPSRSKVEGIVDEFPQGKKVMVHYDPSDPAQAYLVAEESDTGLVMTRLFGYVLLAGALVCLGLGISGLARNFIAKREIADIAKSKAAIPVPTSQIKNQLEDVLGLTCQQEAFPGVHIAYRGWSCKNSPGDMVPVAEIWSRLDEPEKVDLIWMITDQDNLEENKSLLTAVIATVFSGADAQEAQKWCLEILSSTQPAGRQNTTIQGIAIILDSPPDARLNLIIGDSQ